MGGAEVRSSEVAVWRKAEITLLHLMVSLVDALPVVPVLLTPGVTQAPCASLRARFGRG